MRKQMIIALFVAALAIFLSSCAGNNTTGRVSDTDPFIGGTNGLLITFVENAPPAEVYDKGNFPFDVSVRLKNDGEATVDQSNVRVKLSGFDPVEFGLTNAELTAYPTENLLAKQKDPDGNLLEGTEALVEYSGLNYENSLPGNTQYPLRASVCYKYHTQSTSKLCIKEKLLDNSANPLCVVGEDKPVFNSAAPVQVVQFTQSAVGTDKIAFTFKIAKKANGNVFWTPDNTLGFQGCKAPDGQSDRSVEDKVYVEVESISADMTCSALKGDGSTGTTGYVSLYGADKSATIRCTATVDAESDYEKNIKISMFYEYEDTIATTVLVKHEIE